MKGIFHRSELLIGTENFEKLKLKKIIVFGVGGVGSWCAESLVRNGIHSLTLVDSDRVCVTNINRQLMATTKTVGKVKTEALKERLLAINPKADIEDIQEIYSADNAHLFNFDNYDYVIDAIDSLANKIHLVNTVTNSNAVLFCSLGASLKIDPTRIQVGKFWSVKGCPLGSIMRKRMRQRKDYPKKDFICVYSDEVLENQGGETLTCGNSQCLCPGGSHGPGKEELVNHEWCSSKAIINGTMSHITAIFGMTLSGLVTQHILKN